jgi:hypothetical protein
MPVYVEFVLDSVTMRQVSLPCQYHSTIIPYSFSIHLSMALYVHRENACLILTLPSSLLLYSSTDVTSCFTPITLQQLFFMFLISGLCPKVAVNCALLCYCAVSSSNFLLVFQDNLSVPCSEFLGFLNPENRTNSCPEQSVKKPPLLA